MTVKSKSKGFFALDVHQFELIKNYNLGVEEAATYFCLLAGTDQSNVTSSWGINSVVSCAGLTRTEAKRAVQKLDQCGIINCLEVARLRARTAKRYSVPIYDNRRPLSAKEKKIVDSIVAGQPPANPSDVQAAHRAKQKGWIEIRSREWHVIEHSNTVAFIPNSFVKVSEGHSPLYRLVNNGELGPLMLAAELYQNQNLLEDRGVNVDILRGHFRNEGYSNFGLFKIHKLKEGRIYEDPETGEEKQFPRVYNRKWRTSDFWENLSALDAAHVTEWAVYSANGKPNNDDEYGYNRPQRPLGVLRNGKQVLNTPESIPAFMAYLIHRVQTEGGDINRPLSELIADWRGRSPIIAVENTSVSHVEGVSVLRMAHRAATENCKVWFRELCDECDGTFLFLEEAAQSNSEQLVNIADKIRKSPNLNSVISM